MLQMKLFFYKLHLDLKQAMYEYLNLGQMLNDYPNITRLLLMYNDRLEHRHLSYSLVLSYSSLISQLQVLTRS